MRRVPLVLQHETRLERGSRHRLEIKKRCFYLLTEGDIRCKRCGIEDIDVLTIDHVYDDGADDRKQHKSTIQLQYAIINGGKDRRRYQVLCANCNLKKAVQSHRDGALRKRPFTPRFTLHEMMSVKGQTYRKASEELGCGVSTYTRHLLHFGLDSSAHDGLD